VEAKSAKEQQQALLFVAYAHNAIAAAAAAAAAAFPAAGSTLLTAGQPTVCPAGQAEVQILLAQLQQQQQQEEEDEATLAAGSTGNFSTVIQLQEQQQQQQQDLDARVARMLGARWSYSEKYNLEKPIGAWPTATVSVSSGPLGTRVTDTFLATSHEYLRVGDYGDERIVHVSPG
jgi:hypothetical protein